MTKDDVYVGASLYCTHTGSLTSAYIVGNVYKITIDHTTLFYVSSEYGDVPHTLATISSTRCPTFIPLGYLTDRERFLFHMTGIFPERLL